LDEASRTAERLRIARDLHDVIGHQVTALALELEVASHLSEGQAAGQHVSRARRIAKDLLGDLRATVGQLRDEGRPLSETLASIVAPLPEPAVHLDVPATLHLDEQRRTVLVRCVQEIVTNTIRHAGASNLWIDVTPGGDGSVTLRARDDGRGAPQVRHGNGLTGMRERVELVGGELSVTAEDGFRVQARLPVAT
jgi:signal transduction histidine kinase